METIFAILAICFGIWLVVTLLPVIFALVVIVIGAVLLYGLYIRYKIKKRMSQEEPYEQGFTQSFDTRSSSNASDDIIDVEFTETSESDGPYDKRS